MNTKTEQFLNDYKMLEELAIAKYGFPNDGTAVSKLEHLPTFRNIKLEISYCREVRNLLQHKPKIQESYAVEPSEQMIDFLQKTISKVMNPPKARDIAIPKSKILYKAMSDTVRPTMIEMLQKAYTHIPILENGFVVGVFSENTLLSYITNEQIVGVEETTRFFDLVEYLPIGKHTSESFRFVPQDMPIADVSLLFEKALANQDRIGLVFTTQSGKEKEKITGIITAWDIACVK